MKFAHSIVLNAVPEWLEQYVDYDRLKKIVYRVERQNLEHKNTFHTFNVNREPSSSSEPVDEDTREFLQELDRQLDKVTSFYNEKEKEFLGDVDMLNTEFLTFHIPLPNNHNMDNSPSDLEKLDSVLAGTRPLQRQSTQDTFTTFASSIPETDDEETVDRPTHSNSYRTGDDTLYNRKPNEKADSDSEETEYNKYYNFRVRCAATYISLSELKSYITTNKTAFDKILKKWDKVTGGNLRESYFQKIVSSVEPFHPQQIVQLDASVDYVLGMYAAVFTSNNRHNAEVELKMHMRDHIQFERTTVWKDMVGKERETMDAHADVPRKGFTIPFINIFVSHKTLISMTGFLVSVILYIILMCVDTMGQYEASKCLALLVFAAVMWASECIPLFATAMLIPLMVVPMHLVKDSNGNVLDATSAAKLVFSSMFNDTIMVLLGGFSIAASLSKHGIAKAFASNILSKAGSRPCIVILVNMYLATFLCMWISNVATPVLCFSLVNPILRTLRPNSTVAPCLILGIALASCIGGLSSPISSPQNIITINLMDPNPGWGIWFAGAIPCAIITVLTTWGMLLLYFRPDRDTPHLNVVKSIGFAKPSYSQVWVCIVCLATIALWCAESALNSFFGNNGVIAAIPIVLLFGTNMLSKSDLNNFLWSVVVLAQGGMALGYAVQSSGLLDIIGNQIAANVNDLPPLSIIFIFGMLVLCFATFVSHTVAALIILPIVKQVGQNLPEPRANLMVMVTGLVCSVAMGLPVSGFPNMNAIMMEDPTGKPYLTIKDFLLCGLPSSAIASVITICLGYGIISGVGY
ncbi:SPX-domain-containing protein [Backusella circina FSU 941]|nr:SPX-domain-containing protein [Backusella circina FSU 941]